MKGFYFSLWFLILFISFHSITKVRADPDLIEKTCKTTKYYDLCISSLKSNTNSSHEKADTAKELAVIMAKVGVANATATNAFLSSQLLSTTTDPLMKKLLKECAEKYGFASDALQSSVQDLENDLYDYAYMHVMAAADYPNACHNAFKRYPGLSYPSQIAVREEGLKRICVVVLGIIDNLGW